MFISDVVAVTPSRIFNSVAVDVTAVPAIDKVLGLVPISTIVLLVSDAVYKRLLVKSKAGSLLDKAVGAPDPFFSLIVVAIFNPCRFQFRLLLCKCLSL